MVLLGSFARATATSTASKQGDDEPEQKPRHPDRVAINPSVCYRLQTSTQQCHIIRVSTLRHLCAAKFLIHRFRERERERARIICHTYRPVMFACQVVATSVVTQFIGGIQPIALHCQRLIAEESCQQLPSVDGECTFYCQK